MAKTDRLAGVLGGMGPDATVDFMAKVIAVTPAARDQDHVRMLVDHNPRVPSRQLAILADGENPGPVLAAMAARLEASGADFLVIPCNTAHVFQDDILAATRIPLISIVDVSVAATRTEAANASAIGLLATNGCLHAGIYQEALEAAGRSSILPTASELDDLMTLIKSIKAGRTGARVATAMGELAKALSGRGAQAIIAGCTEIPLVLDDAALDVPLISSTDALAVKTVRLALGEIPLPNRQT
jgi:aspartate racemase